MPLKNYRQYRFREKIVYPSYTGMSFARDAAEVIFLCACVIVKGVESKSSLESCKNVYRWRMHEIVLIFAKRILKKVCVNDSLLYMHSTRLFLKTVLVNFNKKFIHHKSMTTFINKIMKIINCKKKKKNRFLN